METAIKEKKVTKKERILSLINEGKSTQEIVEAIKVVIPFTNVTKLEKKIEKLRG